jgi:GGDEF domain-containing protein
MRIQAAVAVPLVFKRTLLSMSASIGIALCGAEHEHPEDALRHAGAAMYRAKSQGRGRFAVADAGLRREIARQTQLEADFA